MAALPSAIGICACDCPEPVSTVSAADGRGCHGMRLRPYLRPLLAMVALCFALPGLAQDKAGGSALTQPDVKAGQETVEDVCEACHGKAGNSTIAANPKLAGQHAEYLSKQLRDFAPGENGKPAARANAVMGAFAAQLSPQDIVNIAAYLSAQVLEPSVSHNAQSVELGRNIYRGGIPAKGVPACAACHGPAGEGMPAQYPRLQGQFAEYTQAQLVAFRDGVRKNNQPMAAIALRMTDPEIKAVADYIAGLRPETH